MQKKESMSAAQGAREKTHEKFLLHHILWDGGSTRHLEVDCHKLSPLL
jgi:hypothetical protein